MNRLFFTKPGDKEFEVRFINGDAIVIDEGDFCDLRRIFERSMVCVSEPFFFLFNARITININQILWVREFQREF